MISKTRDADAPNRTGLGLVFARLLGLKRARSPGERKAMKPSDIENAKKVASFQDSSGSSGRKLFEHMDESSSLVTRNPAPDASPPRAPAGTYRIVKT